MHNLLSFSPTKLLSLTVCIYSGCKINSIKCKSTSTLLLKICWRGSKVSLFFLVYCTYTDYNCTYFDETDIFTCISIFHQLRLSQRSTVILNEFWILLALTFFTIVCRYETDSSTIYAKGICKLRVWWHQKK